ncbi:MAG: trypsin-like peptidase domain-containing protein [Planctomycetaceae bacterium]|nr:trypsin-like peptidase domain-containing protein [Planctomycetaceae bacterium]
MASYIASTWNNATVLIENEFGGRGTGFLVGRQLGEDAWMVTLVTNKHNLHRDPAKRQSAKYVKLHLSHRNHKVSPPLLGKYVCNYAKGSPGSTPNPRPWFVEHPDPDVDVMAFDVSPLFMNWDPQEGLANGWILETDIATRKMWDDLDITVGEEVMVLGYPIGLSSGHGNHPIVRQGIMATTVGIPLIEDNGAGKTRTSRAFLVDGAVVPGSSGSPVVLKPVTARLVHGSITIGISPPILLGIIAETRFAPIGGGPQLGFAGLGMAFDSETILETIHLYPATGPTLSGQPAVNC